LADFPISQLASSRYFNIGQPNLWIFCSRTYIGFVDTQPGFPPRDLVGREGIFDTSSISANIGYGISTRSGSDGAKADIFVVDPGKRKIHSPEFVFSSFQ
jgi:hypothetical protein